MSCGPDRVIPPEELVTVTLFAVPVKVAEEYAPAEVPIKRVPLVGAVVIPVPPDAIGKVPVVRAELLVA
jgi:hypothetical protein